MEYYAAIKKNEILPFAATWLDLVIIILSEINQNIDKYHMVSLIDSKTEMIEMNLFTKQKKTHRCRKQTYDHQRRKVAERDKLGVWDSYIYILL